MFRYYITDLHMGSIIGTNEEKIAKDFASSEDYFVVDVQENLWLAVNGGSAEVLEYKEDDDGDDDDGGEE